ncbi:MAG TPA: hypothetical protein VK929_09440 [Longimicrobiales bacterium]|nr:hypothetical protein [Longimicrobiales bacterium]
MKLLRVVILAAASAVAGTACSDPGTGPGADPPEYLLFLSTRGGATDDLDRPLRDIFRANTDGSGAVNLTGQPTLNYVHASVSPDGRRVAFASDRDGCDIWVMDTSGANLTRLTGPGEGCHGWPRWSPDGGMLAFASNRDGRSQGQHGGLYDVWVMNADGSNARNISAASTDVLGSVVQVVGWTPAGEIMFETYGLPDGDTDRRVFTLRTDGTGRRALLLPGDHSPAWSPDGSRIVFISVRDGFSRLYVMDADGFGEMPLTDHDGDDRLPGGCCRLSAMGFDVDPWSPDGRLVAFERFAGSAEPGTVHTVDVATGQIRKFTNFPASFDGWSPSGRHMAYTRRSVDASDIFVVGTDGSNPTNVTNSAHDDTDALWVRH